jgi:hypothetical protein
MAMLMAQHQAERIDPPLIGDKWVCVSARGAGVPVRVTKVTRLNVMFRTFGRGREHEVSTTLDYDAFMTRYRPMSRVKNRQRELQRLERQQPSQRADRAIGPEAAPITPPEPTPKLVTDAPDATAPSAPVVAVASGASRQDRRKEGKKITADQAREIAVMLREHVPQREVALAYGIHETTVSKIKHGHQWGPETAEIRALPPLPRPVTPPPPPEPPVAVATATPEPEEAPVESLSRKPALDEVQEALRRQAERPVVTTAPALTVRRPDDAELVAELVDALSALVAHIEGPAPSRFLKTRTEIDMKAIKELLAEARRRAG